MDKSYAVEMVDFYRPMEMINREIEELEKKGFIPVFQIGYYLCFANPNAKENEKYKEQILRDSKEQKERAKNFWREIGNISNFSFKEYWAE